MGVVGNFGGESMFDYTAHGDAINTAARLESLNKTLGTRIAVSAAVANQIPGFTGRPAGRFVLKGKSESLEVLEALSPERAESPEVKRYLDAYRMLENGESGSQEAFESVASSDPGDPLAAFYVKRIRSGQSSTTIVMAEK